MKILESMLVDIVRDTFKVDIYPELTRPDEQFGDYTTNIAMQLSGQLHLSPREIADKLAKELLDKASETIEAVNVAGPGFINIALSDKTILSFSKIASNTKPTSLEGQVVVAEYSDPSSFKVLHAGHLYTSVVGDAIANLMESAGGEVHRVNFGGDVGLHVAKTMWAILRELNGEHPEGLDKVRSDQRADWMSARYVEGNAVYDDDEKAKAEIVELNKRIYQLHKENDHDSPFAQIYWMCRRWSYDYFDKFYDRIGSHFEKYYPESETMVIGLRTVNEQLQKGIYEKSDGAIVFRGEKYGLHTRVFINSQGLPTYETKDVGLIMKKWEDYHYDKSVILTDNAQEEYMTVVLKSVEQFAPNLTDTTTHLTHGRVKLAGGVKMSSRKGNIVRAVDVLDIAAEANKALTGHNNQEAVLGAVKYAFLKQRLGADIIYDPKESVSTQGNSGPYLQYAHARACSILKKASAASSPISIVSLQPSERTLARKICEYPDIVQRATNELMPHYICTYLYELAQVFNRFYEHNHVVGDDREALRVQLVQDYRSVLKDGLKILGIVAPEQM